jgi:hypothetical protein
MAKKSFDLSTYLRKTGGLSTWGTADPAGTARGRLAQFRRGLVGVNAARSNIERYAYGSEPGKEQAAISTGLAAEKTAQSAAIAKAQADATRKQAHRAGGDIPLNSGLIGAGGYRDSRIDAEDEELGRVKHISQWEQGHGWGFEDALAYAQGEGRMFNSPIQKYLRASGSPAKEQAYAENMQDDLNMVNNALWQMALHSAAAEYTDVGSLPGVEYDASGSPILITDAQKATYNSALATAAAGTGHAVEKFGLIQSYFYTWQMNHDLSEELPSMEDVVGLGVSSRTKEGKSVLNNYRAYVKTILSAQGIPNVVYNLALSTENPIPIEMIVATGALRVGERIPAEYASIYGYALPENAVELVVGRDEDSNIRVGYTTTPTIVPIVTTTVTPEVFPTAQPGQWQRIAAPDGSEVQESTVIPTPVVEPIVTTDTEDVTWFDSEEFRVRDWSTPQILSADEAKTYFDIDGDIPTNSVFTVTMGGDTPKIISQTINGWTTDFADGVVTTIKSPDNEVYTPDEYDEMVTGLQMFNASQFIEAGVYSGIYEQIKNDINFVNTDNDGVWVKNIVGNVNKQYNINTAAGFSDFINSELDTVLDIIAQQGDTESGRNFLYEITKDENGNGNWGLVNQFYSLRNGNPWEKVEFGLGNMGIQDLITEGVNSPSLSLYTAYSNGSRQLKLDTIEALAYSVYLAEGFSWDYCNKNRTLIAGYVNALTDMFPNKDVSELTASNFKGLRIVDVEDTTSQITPYNAQDMGQWTEATYTTPEFTTIEDFLTFVGTVDGLNFIRDIGPIPENVALLKTMGLSDEEILGFLSIGEAQRVSSAQYDYNNIWKGLVDTFRGGEEFVTNIANLVDSYWLTPNDTSSRAFKEGLAELKDTQFKDNDAGYYMGLLWGQDPSIQALTEAYAPEWAKQTGQWLNPWYALPIGGVLRFTGISSLLGKMGFKRFIRTEETPLMRITRQYIPKTFKTEADFIKFTERIGVKAEPMEEVAINLPGTGLATPVGEKLGGWKLTFEGQVKYFRNIREAATWLKTGDVAGIESIPSAMPYSNIDMYITRNGKPWEINGVPQNMRLFDTVNIESLFETQKWYKKFVKNSPLYEAGNFEKIEAAVLDTFNKGQMTPAQLMSFALKVSRTIAETGPRVASQYMATIEKLCGYPIARGEAGHLRFPNKLFERDGKFISGINMEATQKNWKGPLSADGLISTVVNDVAQNARYYVFNEQGALDYFLNMYQLVDSLERLAWKHGVKMGRIDLAQVFELAHYLPRGYTGRKGIEAIKLKYNPAKHRRDVYDLMIDAMDDGLIPDSFQHVMETYTKGIYKMIGGKAELQIMNVFRKVVASTMLKGQILLKNEERAQVYAKNATKLTGIIKDFKDVPFLLPKNKAFLTRFFKDDIYPVLKEVQSLYRESIDVRKLDDIITRLKAIPNSKALTAADKTWMRRNFKEEYDTLIDMFEKGSAFKRSQARQILEDRLKVIQKVNKELYSPEDIQGLLPDTISAMIKDMKFRIENMFKYSMPYKEVMRGLPKKNNGVYRDLLKYLEDYDLKIRKPKKYATAELENIDNQMRGFMERNFSELKGLSGEMRRDANSRLDDLLDVVKKAEAEAKTFAKEGSELKKDFFRQVDKPDETWGEAISNLPRYHNFVFEEISAAQRSIRTLGIKKQKMYTGQELKNIMESHMAPHIDTLLSAAYKGMRGVVTVMTSIDLSAALTFGYYLMSNPKNLVKAFSLSSAMVLQPKVLNWVRVLEHRLCEEYIPLGMKTAADLNDFYAGLGFLRSVADRIPIVGKLAMIPFGRASIAFAGFGEIGRIYTIKSMERSWLKAGGTKLELTEFANLVSCSLPDMLKPGSKRITLAEGAAAFAPNFLRANIVLLYRLKNGGIMGRELRKVILKSWAGWNALYSAIWYATGNKGTPHIAPWDQDYMRFEYEGSVYGMPGFMPQTIRTMARIYALAEANPDKLISISENGWRDTFGAWEDLINPAVTAAGYKASPGLTFIREMITGRDVMGKKLDGTTDYLQAFSEMWMPIIAANVIYKDATTTPLNALASIFALNNYPISASKQWYRFADEWVKTLSSDDLPDDLAQKQDLGTLTWKDLGYSLQQLYLAQNPELAEMKGLADAASMPYRADEWLHWFDDKNQIELDYIAYENSQYTLLQSGAIDMPTYIDNLRQRRSDDSIRKEDLKKEHKKIYDSWETPGLSKSQDQSYVDVAIDAYYDMVWGEGVLDPLGSEGGRGIDWDVQESALNNWKTTYDPDGTIYDIVLELQEAGFKDENPLALRLWEMGDVLEPYWQLPRKDREVFRENPMNLDIEATLIFMGYTSTIQNPNAEAIVRQWCSELGIDPDKTIPALTKLIIPDIMLQRFEGLQPNDLREYNNLPTEGYVRERYIVEHPAFKAYATSTEEVDGQKIGFLSGFNEQGEDLYTWDKVPTVVEEQLLNTYDAITGNTTAKQIWRCTYPEGDRVLGKFIGMSGMDGDVCARLLAQPSSSSITGSSTMVR